MFVQVCGDILSKEERFAIFKRCYHYRARRSNFGYTGRYPGKNAVQAILAVNFPQNADSVGFWQ